MSRLVDHSLVALLGVQVGEGDADLGGVELDSGKPFAFTLDPDVGPPFITFIVPRRRIIISVRGQMN